MACFLSKRGAGKPFCSTPHLSVPSLDAKYPPHNNLLNHPLPQATNPLTRNKKGGQREISKLASTERRQVQWYTYKKRYAIDDYDKGAARDEAAD